MSISLYGHDMLYVDSELKILWSTKMVVWFLELDTSVNFFKSRLQLLVSAPLGAFLKSVL